MGHPLLLCTTVLVFCYSHHKKILNYFLSSLPYAELGLNLHKVTHFRLPKLPNCCPSAEPSIVTNVLFKLPVKCASLKLKRKWEPLKVTGLGLDLSVPYHKGLAIECSCTSMSFNIFEKIHKATEWCLGCFLHYCP